MLLYDIGMLLFCIILVSTYLGYWLGEKHGFNVGWKVGNKSITSKQLRSIKIEVEKVCGQPLDNVDCLWCPRSVAMSNITHILFEKEFKQLADELSQKLVIKHLEQVCVHPNKSLLS